MSMTINAYAIKPISDKDKEMVQLFNLCRKTETEVPPNVITHIKEEIGIPEDELEYKNKIELEDGMVEVEIETTGNVMEGDGMRIGMADLPEDTHFIRVGCPDY